MTWRKIKKYAYRDVSAILAGLRQFLLGRRHTLHARFPPYISPRSIPPPDIPRGVEYKYSNQYYCNRSYVDTSMPPVVAPVAEGPPVALPKHRKPFPGGVKPDFLTFSSLPTPGPSYWWDGHFYFECVPDKLPGKPPCPKE